jgi:hypothetical protein
MATARRSFGAACMSLLLMGQTAPTDAAAYESEAALIFKIGKFVRWPAGTFTHSPGILRLCILGTDEGGESIDSLAGQKLQEKVIAIARITTSEQPATECHMIFIRKSERDRVAAVLQSIARNPVLTISDIEGFASEGGMVGFSSADGRVHFQINVAASKRVGLTIGAQLLQIASLSADQTMDAGP